MLIACFGNALRGDDAFGVAVARRLTADPLPDTVRVLDVGIGGIHLVQELLAGVDVLVVVDAVDIGRRAGTVITQVPRITDVSELTPDQRRDQLADMHYATPERALMLAAGLGVLPETTLLVGVQTTDTDRIQGGLSTATAAAVDVAIDEVRRLIAQHQPPSPD
jgi:hydrogenase maturation protease